MSLALMIRALIRRERYVVNGICRETGKRVWPHGLDPKRWVCEWKPTPEGCNRFLSQDKALIAAVMLTATGPVSDRVKVVSVALCALDHTPLREIWRR